MAEFIQFQAKLTSRAHRDLMASAELLELDPPTVFSRAIQVHHALIAAVAGGSELVIRYPDGHEIIWPARQLLATDDLDLA